MGETPLSMTKKEFTREVSSSLKGCGSHVTITCQSHLFRNILRPNLDSDKNIYTGDVSSMQSIKQSIAISLEVTMVKSESKYF